MKKNLIIGAIKGYQFEKIKPFVISLKNIQFDGDVYFLTNKLPDNTILKIKEIGFFNKEISYRGGVLNSWSRFWPYLKPFINLSPSPVARLILKKILPLQTVRFLHYKDFLIKNKEKYENVLLTDVRDVFFQKDPFSLQKHSKVQCYEENGILGEETMFNVPWIRSMYGPESINSFSSKKILCSGTILGPVIEMIEFLDDFERVILKASQVGIGGSDQGMYNYLIRKFISNKVSIVKNDTGEVMTVANNESNVFKISNQGVCNERGELVPVVHQYDRNSQINQLVEELFYQNRTEESVS